MDYKLRWSEEAVKNLQDILDYLGTYWSDKEVQDFKNELKKTA